MIFLFFSGYLTFKGRFFEARQADLRVFFEWLPLLLVFMVPASAIRDLPPESPYAMICTFECTFCRQCVDAVYQGICPNCGGNFAPAIKKCGYDAIFFKGISHAPVFLCVDERGAREAPFPTQPAQGSQSTELR